MALPAFPLSVCKKKGKSVTQPRINSFFILLNLYLHAYIKKTFLFNHIFKTRTVAAKGNSATRATFARKSKALTLGCVFRVITAL